MKRHLVFFMLLFSDFIRASQYCNVIVKNPFEKVITVSSIMPTDTGTDIEHTFTIAADVEACSFRCRKDAEVTLSIENRNPFKFKATGKVTAYSVTREGIYKIDSYLCYH